MQPGSPLRPWTPGAARSCRWPGCLRPRPGSGCLWEPPSAASASETPAWGDTQNRADHSSAPSSSGPPHLPPAPVGMCRTHLSSLKGSALTCGVSTDLANTAPSAPEITGGGVRLNPNSAPDRGLVRETGRSERRQAGWSRSAKAKAGAAARRGCADICGAGEGEARFYATASILRPSV